MFKSKKISYTQPKLPPQTVSHDYLFNWMEKVSTKQLRHHGGWKIIQSSKLQKNEIYDHSQKMLGKQKISAAHKVNDNQIKMSVPNIEI